VQESAQQKSSRDEHNCNAGSTDRQLRPAVESFADSMAKRRAQLHSFVTEKPANMTSATYKQPGSLVEASFYGFSDQCSTLMQTKEAACRDLSIVEQRFPAIAEEDGDLSSPGMQYNSFAQMITSTDPVTAQMGRAMYAIWVSVEVNRILTCDLIYFIFVKLSLL